MIASKDSFQVRGGLIKLSVKIRNTIFKSLMGFAVATLGAVLQWNFWEWLAPNRFIVFFPVVIITSLLGGLSAGIAGTLSCTLFAIYYFFPPLYSFQIDGDAGFAPVLLFVFSGISVSIMNHILKRRQIKL
ncbi:MAG TPA: DUF4118 domain-containing protein, partial [Pseudobdellovibrionaceae bacterium]|nr:DUF4118 domain-containing protein [Pseudobdellovibrionaceae bacterium]